MASATSALMRTLTFSKFLHALHLDGGISPELFDPRVFFDELGWDLVKRQRTSSEANSVSITTLWLKICGRDRLKSGRAHSVVGPRAGNLVSKVTPTRLLLKRNRSLLNYPGDPL